MLLQTWLIVACCLQLFFCFSLLHLFWTEKGNSTSLSSQLVLLKYQLDQMKKFSVGNSGQSSISLHEYNLRANSDPTTLEGQAATIMLHEPKWFQRRYTMMLLQVLANLPKNWKLQVFYTGKGQSQAGIDINPGFQRLIRDERVVLTLIPEKLAKRKRKKFQLMTDRWLWESMLTDRVFLFGGNSVICSNSQYTLRDFMDYDYIGTPWKEMKGLGGDGGCSFGGMNIRNRRAMLDAIEYEWSKPHDDKDFDLEFGQEDKFFLTRLQDIQKQTSKKYKIATAEETRKFGAGGSYANESVLVVSSTLQDTDWKSRELFIQYCPELKMLFPVLHDPSCYGASPDKIKCADSICALKDRKDRPGGC